MLDTNFMIFPPSSQLFLEFFVTSVLVTAMLLRSVFINASNSIFLLQFSKETNRTVGNETQIRFLISLYMPIVQRWRVDNFK